MDPEDIKLGKICQSWDKYCVILLIKRDLTLSNSYIKRIELWCPGMEKRRKRVANHRI